MKQIFEGRSAELVQSGGGRSAVESLSAELDHSVGGPSDELGCRMFEPQVTVFILALQDKPKLNVKLHICVM